MSGGRVSKGTRVALITEFHRVTAHKQEIHKPVSCGWRSFNEGGTTILQLDTYGSDERKMLNKVSQSMQLDRVGAAMLLKLIRETFPGL